MSDYRWNAATRPAVPGDHVVGICKGGHDSTETPCEHQPITEADVLELVEAVAAAQAEARELKQRIDIMLCQACHDRCNTPPTGLFHSPDPEEEPCIICWLEQQSDETVKHAERADKAEAEARELRERAEKAERNYQWMVERAADQHLSGYRELARRAADAENVADGLRTELARVREIVSGMREYADSCDHPSEASKRNAVEYWLTKLEDALSQAVERESPPLMARRRWMPKAVRYCFRNRDCGWFFSLNTPTDGEWEFVFRIADTDEHGLPVVERTADMPEDVTHMTLHTRRFFRAGELRARSVEGDEGLVRIEDYRPAAQESGDAQP